MNHIRGPCLQHDVTHQVKDFLYQHAGERPWDFDSPDSWPCMGGIDDELVSLWWWVQPAHVECTLDQEAYPPKANGTTACLETRCQSHPKLILLGPVGFIAGIKADHSNTHTPRF